MSIESTWYMTYALHLREGKRDRPVGTPFLNIVESTSILFGFKAVLLPG